MKSQILMVSKSGYFFLFFAIEERHGKVFLTRFYTVIMNNNRIDNLKTSLRLISFCVCVLASISIGCGPSNATGAEEKDTPAVEAIDSSGMQISTGARFDTLLYDQLVRRLSHNDTSEIWPVGEAYPGMGALLPFSRIIAFYGNLYSTRMGVLGALPQTRCWIACKVR